MVRKKVYFVRHGESRANVDGVFHGAEVSLTRHGEAQARSVALRCKKLRPEAILSSTMERARQTAGPISDVTGIPIEYSGDFVERLEPTSLLGLPSEDKGADALNRKWTESFFTSGVRVEDGENFEDIRDRAARALQHIEERPEECIIAVTHGFFLRVIIAHVTFDGSFTPDEFKHLFLAFRTTNTGITCIQSVGDDIWQPWMGSRKWVVRAWNDHAHLGEYRPRSE